ncbi:Histidine phosphatase superfamily,clade-2-containing protein [Strongyloides ratti]|uniref:Histidine phosphatase superfamily,clade-2-containing protein n=1 Tax=Strongyloides ratti TaxID=34506 RepID=A0A090KYC5_STRRB|nr:Histidine phosphatase superfamily,clade-2-containing protein [Strongyloides ratti]CEF60882.1 Histidine phosphatase superfamily,clade-2-containing protein [Strongyloides ratti]
MVQVVWRHGERTPTHGYPNDLYKEDYWEAPYGTLTKNGIKQQEKLGKRLRNMYIVSKKFISKKYNPKEIQVRSTQKNRTIESAYANLRGFYNIKSSKKIPILTDFFGINDIWYKGKSCPRLNVLINNRIKFIEKKVYNENKNFICMLEKKSGFSKMSLNKISDLYDILYIQKKLKKKMPKWLKKNIFRKLRKLACEVYKVIDGAASFGMKEDLEITKLYEGPLLKTILEYFQTKINDIKTKNIKFKYFPSYYNNNSSNKLKYVAYSVHDFTISGLFFSMGISDFMENESLTMDFTATLFYELYINKKNQFEIKLFFSRNYAKNIIDITNRIIGCKKKKICLFKDFKKRILKRIPTSIKKECNYK